MVKNAVIVFLVILVAMLVYQVNALAPTDAGMMPSDQSGQATTSTTGTPATKPTTPAAAATTPARAKDGTYLITYTNAGFSPATLEIPRGSSVRWTDNSTSGLRVHTTDLIDRAPTNVMNQSATIKKGQTYSFTFSTPSVYGYMNQNTPEHKAVIVVKQ